MDTTLSEWLAMPEKICCFTGHRNLPPLKVNQVAQRLERAITQLLPSGTQYFMAGGAMGFDTLAAQAVLKLHKQFPHIKLILVLPCLSQTKGWQDNDIKIYEEIKAQADQVIYTSEEYTRGCMHKRNRYLVDHSSTCICYLTEDHGGTAYTVKYADKRHLQIINLANMEGTYKYG